MDTLGFPWEQKAEDVSSPLRASADFEGNSEGNSETNSVSWDSCRLESDGAEKKADSVERTLAEDQSCPGDVLRE